MAKKRPPENRRRTGRRGGRRSSTSFQPGKSGNPGGRPKLPPEIVELRALARTHTPEAMNAIVEVMMNKNAPPSARVAAASEIFDRGWGRATATLEHSGPGGGPIPVAASATDYAALLAMANAKAKAGGKG